MPCEPINFSNTDSFFNTDNFSEIERNLRRYAPFLDLLKRESKNRISSKSKYNVKSACSGCRFYQLTKTIPLVLPKYPMVLMSIINVDTCTRKSFYTGGGVNINN